MYYMGLCRLSREGSRELGCTTPLRILRLVRPERAHTSWHGNLGSAGGFALAGRGLAGWVSVHSFYGAVTLGGKMGWDGKWVCHDLRRRGP